MTSLREPSQPPSGRLAPAYLALCMVLGLTLGALAALVDGGAVLMLALAAATAGFLARDLLGP